MTFITANWQLKVLSVLLAIGLLSVVAFEQNPITTKTVKANVVYDSQPPDKMLIDPVRSVQLTVFGTSAQVQNVHDNSVLVHVNLLRIDNGQHQLVGRPTLPAAANVSAFQNSIPITVNLDDKEDIALPITARVSYGTGWQEDKPPAVSVPTVSVSLPASFVGTGADKLVAYVEPPAPVTGTENFQNMPVKFEKGGKSITFPNTSPPSAYDPQAVELDVFARKPTVTRQTTLVETPTGQPASGYRISGVQISPLFLTVTGPADALASLDNIVLPSVNVPSGATSDFNSRVQIPFPTGVNSDTKSATVTVNISQNPAVQPSPSPTR